MAFDDTSARRFAAIDIGTVTCRMLIADVDRAGHIRDVDREYRIVNLGEGVDATGVLKPQAIERAVCAVADFMQVLERFRTNRFANIPVTAMATSASRDAKNADEFVCALRAVGVELSVIPGEREAALSFSGASCDFPGERLFVVDVGGGSTEVVAGVAGDQVLLARSFDIGCRRVTERFFHTDPPAPEELARSREWMRETMAPYFETARAAGFEADRLVAVAGTATTVVAIREALARYDTSRVHGAVVTRFDLDAVYEQLIAVPLERRKLIVGLDPGRAPVIVAGMVILQTVLDLAGVNSFTVSESDILHGIILAEDSNRRFAD
ncbi:MULTISPECIES: Ppx/GppA phosphatase family protein [unclassified Adlercreutzia]|uniref:Ppx/GppA phosphatase family protein n=1 Tax=unclassified Adlercreutzia TaxID=2636013 RepID=UPI0013EDC29E|nr:MULTISPECIES: Ppx/GppA phosphatase family protein [unclassified Adlercreutzia]